MYINYSGNIVNDILQSKGLERKDVYLKSIGYNVRNSSYLNELLAFNTRIVVFADCDTDGLCAGAICNIYLKDLPGYEINYVVAKRDRRGFQEEDVKYIIEQYPQATAILTVDCGITSVAAVEYAKMHGIDVLITDHHEPQADLPDCQIINPKLDDRPLFKDFCGAALIYMCFKDIEGENYDALQYAAIATVADVMPLVSDNRYIVKTGLELLSNSETACKNLVEFAKTTGINIKSAKDIGWSVAPLINSASRLNQEETAASAIIHSSNISAKDLLKLNEKRKEIVNFVFEQSDSIELSAHAVSVRADIEYVGLLGLLAMKASSTYGLPAIAHCVIDGINHFSLRGVGSFDFLISLGEYIDGGGHDEAAGFSSSLSAQQVIELFYIWHENLYINNKHNCQTEKGADGEIRIDFDKIVSKLSIKESLAPYGYGFEEPVFRSTDVIIKEDGKTNSGRFNKYIVSYKKKKVTFYDFNGIIRPAHLDKPVIITYNINYSSFNYKPVVELLTITSGE